MSTKNKTMNKNFKNNKINHNLEKYAGYSYKSPDPSELPIPSFLLSKLSQKPISLMYLIEEMNKNQEKN